MYRDARKVAPSEYDWILFDGGESRDDPVEESEKFMIPWLSVWINILNMILIKTA